jgi:hypothetical protein
LEVFVNNEPIRYDYKIEKDNLIISENENIVFDIIISKSILIENITINDEDDDYKNNKIDFNEILVIYNYNICINNGYEVNKETEVSLENGKNKNVQTKKDEYSYIIGLRVFENNGNEDNIIKIKFSNESEKNNFYTKLSNKVNLTLK